MNVDYQDRFIEALCESGKSARYRHRPQERAPRNSGSAQVRRAAGLCVELQRSDQQPAVFFEFGPTVVVENNRVPLPLDNPDHSRVFVTLQAPSGEDISKAAQTDVSLADVLTEPQGDDYHLRNAVLAHIDDAWPARLTAIVRACSRSGSHLRREIRSVEGPPPGEARSESLWAGLRTSAKRMPGPSRNTRAG